MSALSSPFNGDVKPAPGAKSGANEMAGPPGSPATLETPFMEGVFSYKKADQLLGVTTQVDLPHKPANISSPFMGDFRPGVDSSKS